MKRKTFKNILLKNIVVSIGVALILLIISGVTAMQCAVYAVKKNYVHMQEQYAERMQGRYFGVAKRDPNLTEEEILNQVYDIMRSDVSIVHEKVTVDNILFSAMAIYRLDDNELIAKTHNEAWIEMRDTESNHTQKVFCHPSTLNKIRGYCDMYSYAVIRDYYVSENSAYLGKVEFYNYVDGEPVEIVDLKPLDYSEYTYVEIYDVEKYDFFGLNYYEQSENNTHLIQLHNYIYNTDWETPGFEYDVNNFNILITGDSNFYLPDGSRYVLFSSANVDLFYSYGEWIVLYLVLVFVISICIAVLISYIKHIKLKSVYEMEDYRRTLTDSMAHDLKSPLMAVSGYAQNLKENVNTDKKDYYATAIIDNAQYMNNIIDNVLKLSQLESNKIVINKTETDLRVLINECLKKYEDAFEEKSLIVEIKGDINISCDEGLLLQAFDNLISNAVKYSDADSSIEICIEKDKKRVVIINSCKKTLNIAPEELCKPYVKGDNARSNKLGTGIGLSISKNILNMHGFKQNIMWENETFVVEILLSKK